MWRIIMVKSPECGFENPERVTTCFECGNKITTDVLRNQLKK
jgi:hypothetical protein